VAFVVKVKPVPKNPVSLNPPLLIYSDPLVDPAAGSLAGGQERLVLADTSGNRIFIEPVLSAGIFADGATTGDKMLLRRLILRRSNFLLAVETAMEYLSDAGGKNVPRQQLIGQFRKMAESLHHWYLPPEQQVGSGVYQSIMRNLAKLPEVEIGSPFPPADFVSQQTAALNRRRAALLNSLPNLAEALY
jgi:hypothetical protein